MEGGEGPRENVRGMGNVKGRKGRRGKVKFRQGFHWVTKFSSPSLGAPGAKARILFIHLGFVLFRLCGWPLSLFPAA